MFLLRVCHIFKNYFKVQKYDYFSNRQNLFFFLLIVEEVKKTPAISRSFTVPPTDHLLLNTYSASSMAFIKIYQCRQYVVLFYVIAMCLYL